MATIKVARPYEYTNGLRKYDVCIDGLRVGKIANGETLEFEVTPGKHRLVTRVDWCSSEEITYHIGEHETLTIQTKSFKYANWLAPAAIFLFLANAIIPNLVGDFWLFSVIIPAALLLVYYMTFGRHKYLTLKKLA